MTEYFVQRVGSNQGEFTDTRTRMKKSALDRYSYLCETYPQVKFKIVKRIITDEVIAESEDVRQARFDFVQ
jgi:hypothetical protein